MYLIDFIKKQNINLIELALDNTINEIINFYPLLNDKDINIDFFDKLKTLLNDSLNRYFNSYWYETITFNDRVIDRDGVRLEQYTQKFLYWLETKIRELINNMFMSFHALKPSFNNPNEFSSGILTIMRYGFYGNNEVEMNNLFTDNGTVNLNANKTNNQDINYWYKTIKNTIHDFYFKIKYDLFNQWLVGLYV